MRSWMWAMVLVLFAIPMVRAGDNSGGNTGRGRKKTGDYTLVALGNYSGTGASSITTTTVSISVDLRAPDGSRVTLSFSDMPLVNDRFQGTTISGGAAFTLSGRVDLPAATDADQTPAQAITGRLTSTLEDSTGKGARLVAIQNESARGG
jgi:hypothetical protein